jgi:hypothetical protein
MRLTITSKITIKIMMKNHLPVNSRVPSLILA